MSTTAFTVEPIVSSGVADTFAWIMVAAFWILAAFVGSILGHATIPTGEGTESTRSRFAQQALISAALIGGAAALIYLLGVDLPIPAAAIAFIAAATAVAALAIYRAAHNHTHKRTAGPTHNRSTRTSDQ